MKKLFLIVSLGLLAPLSSFAFDATAGEKLNLNTPIGDDYYVAGGEASLNAEVKGDVCAVGGKLFFNAPIKKDLLVAAGEQTINGNIGESLRALGGKVFLDGVIEKDALLAGGEVTLGEKSNIKGETKIGAGKIDFAGTANNVDLNAGEIFLKGTIKGNATLRAERIEVVTGAKILGNLYYESATQNTGLEQIVAGKVSFTQKTYNRQGFIESFAGMAGARFAFLFVFGLILLFVGQNRIRSSIETIKTSPRESLGYGFLTYVLLPIAAVVSVISIIGLPFSFFFIAVFITLLIFAKLINVYFYTNLLINKWGGYEKLNNRKKIGILLGCSILSAILSGIDIIFTFFAVGAIVKTRILKK